MIASPAEPKGPHCPMLICSCKFDTILRPERSPSFVGDVVSQFWRTMSVEERNCGKRRSIRRNRSQDRPGFWHEVAANQHSVDRDCRMQLPARAGGAAGP